MAARNADSCNFGGHDGRYIYYRGMKLPFQNGRVLLVRRAILGINPARNVKFLGNLLGDQTEWGEAFAGATRAKPRRQRWPFGAAPALPAHALTQRRRCTPSVAGAHRASVQCGSRLRSGEGARS